MSKHTEGKLKAVVVEGSLFLVNDDESRVINTIALLADAREGDANRLAACWNALKGYTTKNLEGVDFKSNHDSLCDLLSIAINERDKERAMRKIALEALEEIRHYEGETYISGEIADKAIKSIIKHAEKEDNQ